MFSQSVGTKTSECWKDVPLCKKIWTVAWSGKSTQMCFWTGPSWSQQVSHPQSLYSQLSSCNIKSLSILEIQLMLLFFLNCELLHIHGVPTETVCHFYCFSYYWERVYFYGFIVWKACQLEWLQELGQLPSWLTRKHRELRVGQGFTSTLSPVHPPDLLPPVRPHLLKGPQSLQMPIPAGDSNTQAYGRAPSLPLKSSVLLFLFPR